MGKTHRCVEFKKEYLDRQKATYNVPDKIEIITAKANTERKTTDTDTNTG